MRVGHKVESNGDPLSAQPNLRPSAEPVALDAAAVSQRAGYDDLTGLGDRQMLQSRFQEERRRQSFEALLHVALDGFSAVNEAYGREIGDRMLRAVAARMLDSLRQNDFVGRLGGDRFVVLLSRTGRHDGVDSMALRLLRVLSKTFAIDDYDIDIGASIGSARCHPEELGLDDLIHRADEALYQAKVHGRGRHVSFERTESRHAERFAAKR